MSDRQRKSTIMISHIENGIAVTKMAEEKTWMFSSFDEAVPFLERHFQDDSFSEELLINDQVPFPQENNESVTSDSREVSS